MQTKTIYKTKKLRFSCTDQAVIAQGDPKQKARVFRKRNAETVHLATEMISTARLRQSGLYDYDHKPNTLTVRRISDMTPEEKKELGL